MDTFRHKLTIIVVTHNSMEVLPSFLKNLNKALADDQCDILVCDNGSQDGIEDFIKSQYPKVKLLKSNKNEGYGAGLNRGIINAVTPFIALMNPDVAIAKGGFEKLLGFMEEKPMAAGVSGPVVHLSEILEDNNCLQLPKLNKMAICNTNCKLSDRILYYSGLQTRFRRFHFFVSWALVDPCDSISVSALNGSFGLFRKESLIKAGLFDPRFFLYFEENDIALRLKKNGYELYVTDRTIILHTPGKGSALSRAIAVDKILLNSQYLFFNKHKGLFYAWFSFFNIWAVLTIVTVYQLIFNRSGSKKTASLWKWHLESLLSLGGLPEGTIPNGGKEDVNYMWSK